MNGTWKIFEQQKLCFWKRCNCWNNVFSAIILFDTHVFNVFKFHFLILFVFLCFFKKNLMRQFGTTCCVTCLLTCRVTLSSRVSSISNMQTIRAFVISQNEFNHSSSTYLDEFWSKIYHFLRGRSTKIVQKEKYCSYIYILEGLRPLLAPLANPRVFALDLVLRRV